MIIHDLKPLLGVAIAQHVEMRPYSAFAKVSLADVYCGPFLYRLGVAR